MKMIVCGENNRLDIPCLEIESAMKAPNRENNTRGLSNNVNPANVPASSKFLQDILSKYNTMLYKLIRNIIIMSESG
jgi:hypothetical protein